MFLRCPGSVDLWAFGFGENHPPRRHRRFKKHHCGGNRNRWQNALLFRSRINRTAPRTGYRLCSTRGSAFPASFGAEKYPFRCRPQPQTSAGRRHQCRTCVERPGDRQSVGPSGNEALRRGGAKSGAGPSDIIATAIALAGRASGVLGHRPQGKNSALSPPGARRILNTDDLCHP